MKKIKRFLKKYCLYFAAAVIAAILSVMNFDLLHEIATLERGYEAIGGELAAFLVPFIAYVIYRNIKDARTTKNTK